MGHLGRQRRVRGRATLAGTIADGARTGPAFLAGAALPGVTALMSACSPNRS